MHVWYPRRIAWSWKEKSILPAFLADLNPYLRRKLCTDSHSEGSPLEIGIDKKPLICEEPLQIT